MVMCVTARYLLGRYNVVQCADCGGQFFFAFSAIELDGSGLPLSCAVSVETSGEAVERTLKWGGDKGRLGRMAC